MDAWLGGADYVELDIHMSSDGYLIVNHDQCLKPSTNAVLFDGLWKSRQKTFTLRPSNAACV
jgi:glycerophosphoryl diester phosphodiesterase